ncbi:MAG: L,D-transpeptidase [Solirubrobacteraceae bacterium]
MIAGVAAVVMAALAAGAGARVTPRALTVRRLRLIHAFTVHGHFVTVPHRQVTVSVTLPGVAAGTVIRFSTREGTRVFKRRRLTYRGRAEGNWHFVVNLDAPAVGNVRVILHRVPGQGRPAFTIHTGFRALDANVSPGATGQFVELLQQRLAALHIYLPQTGVYDLGTQLALDTYHRLLGEGEGHMQLDAVTVTDLLDGRGVFHVRYPLQGHHVEGDLSDQVIAFINGSRVAMLFPISSGKPSTPTILGKFQVYYKEPYYTPDGMYFSSFFYSGYAIHGYDPAPDYPASHGCMRLPMSDAITAYNWLHVGDWVDTYYT